MRNLLLAVSMLLCSVTSAFAQVSVSIGINLPVYPQLVPVPGYPVYYAPQVNSNYFFYDGMYWVYQRDNWYASSWYNGPWGLVAPEAVPLFVLRVPVRYYRRPPAYFRGWRSDAPPRWGEHWGNSWEQSHGGWDNWNRSSVPAPAPLPLYQRQYSGTRYPRAEQQRSLQSQNYRYQPQDAIVQRHYETQRVQSAPAAFAPPDERGTGRPPASQPNASPGPRGQPPQTGGAAVQRAPVRAPVQQVSPPAQRPTQSQSPPQAPVQREQRAPGPQGQNQKPATRPSPQEASPAGQRASPPQAAARQQQQPQQQQPRQQQQQQQQAPGSQGQDKGAQGKGSAQQAKQGRERGEQQGGEGK